MLSLSSEPVVSRAKPAPSEQPGPPKPGRVMSLLVRWATLLLARYNLVPVPVEDLAYLGNAFEHVMTSQAIQGPFHGAKQERLLNSRKRVEFWCGKSVQKIVGLLKRPE